MPEGSIINFLPHINLDHDGGSSIPTTLKPRFQKSMVFLESTRPTALYRQSNTGPAGCLGFRNAHFLSIFNCRRRPQSCSGSGQNKLVIVLSRTHRYTGLFLCVYAKGCMRADIHCNDDQPHQESFL